MIDYLLLFGSAFLSATVLPFYSEVILASLLAKQPDNWPMLWLVASWGNTLGAAVNWGIGKYLLHYRHRRWFPIKEHHLERGQRWFQRYGVWSLLMAWLPLGGDAITFIAGIMNVRFSVFLALVFLGKGLRYLMVIYLADSLLL
ncbi:YqaA family protein [Marinobacterium arenosum]|uniref:YqaA family protein n=1 Tax=Marinobacterium arenosum TaxID=2862496 RepID=UPI001C948778|nr:YqaA family protein [Marinobacterium arenosum]MBY4677405.1 DedA family protein [Marinobacterium arenosum]